MSERSQVVVVGALALVSAAMVMVATTRGAGLDPDAVHYMSSGINLGNGRGLTSYTGETLTVWPPGLPFVAALGEWSNISADLAVRLFESACFVAIVGLAYVGLRRVTSHAWLRLGLTAFVAISPSILDITKKAWTDGALVVAAVLLTLVLTEVWRASAMSLSLLGFIVTLCWFGFIFRYAGLVLIVVAALGVALAVWPRGMSYALGWTAAVGFVSAVVPAAWVVRNYSVGGTALGPRGSGARIAESLEGVLLTFGQWVFPAQSAPKYVLIPIGIVACAVVTASSLIAFRRVRRSSQQDDGLRNLCPREAALASHLLLLTVYLVFIVASASRTNVVQLNYRLLSPILISCVTIFAFGVDRVVARVNMRRLSYVAGVAIGVFLLGHLATSVRDVRVDRRDGILFASSEWTESDLAAATLAQADDSVAAFLTNRPEALWSATKLEPVGRLQSGAEQLTQCFEFPVLVPLYGADNSANVSDLEMVFELREIGRHSDGTLYLAVGPRASSALPPCNK